MGTATPGIKVSGDKQWLLVGDGADTGVDLASSLHWIQPVISPAAADMSLFWCARIANQIVPLTRARERTSPPTTCSISWFFLKKKVVKVTVPKPMDVHLQIQTTLKSDPFDRGMACLLAHNVSQPFPNLENKDCFVLNSSLLPTNWNQTLTPITSCWAQAGSLQTAYFLCICGVISWNMSHVYLVLFSCWLLAAWNLSWTSTKMSMVRWVATVST